MKCAAIAKSWKPKSWQWKQPPSVSIWRNDTCYVTGKFLLEQTLADYAKQVEDRGEEFNLRNFFDQLNAIDSIPISLGRWELTGINGPVLE